MTSKGRITLPMSVRKALGLRPGAKMEFIAQGDGFKVVALDTHVSTLKGRFAGRVANPVNLEAMDPASDLDPTL
ncbi:AbrB/MazE/SpoVT family DNA-binding domain-containing protein [Variovorax ginsengisoli]|uniref:AbrB/MazE/SpoVT family DNA-binding domain-containing protein n=1 Tax=Variovorax guangxiensis TaxID=1775474 RepID=A0A502E015_9BURK|nr:AbrB/MazE/SpoVT family DNA-binding domain-containing protein [Variovorax ginsengisoli]TPG31055.1 AbrB/MazE/SpoVT family DNA-binding domain-containing protein [Variovorax guangxiensis]